MTFKLACGDVMPGCAAHFESSDRTDLLQRVQAHAASDHGMATIEPQMWQSLESRITTSA